MENFDKKQLTLTLVDLLALLTSDEIGVSRVITKDDTTYYITKKDGFTIKLIKS